MGFLSLKGGCTGSSESTLVKMPHCWKSHAQTDQSLCLSLKYSMSVKLLDEHLLEFLSLKGGCAGSCESTLVRLLEITCTYAQTDQSLCFSLKYSMSVKLLTKHLLEFLSLKGG